MEHLWEHVVSLAAREHTTMEVAFSVQSMPRLYNEDQLPLQDSAEMAVRRAGGWCEMAASLQVE
jgi:hypothetical protein